MPNPTLQEILTYFHERGYSDTNIAKNIGLSQATINNIRNGKQSGERNQDKFRTLIHAFLNDEELDIPHTTPSIPKPVVNTPKPANTTQTNVTTLTHINDNKTDDNMDDEKPEIQPIHVASFIIPLIFVLGILLFISHMTKQNRMIQQTHTTPIANEPLTNGNTPINTPFPYQYGYHIQGEIGF